jgi:hypothetical protein
MSAAGTSPFTTPVLRGIVVRDEDDRIVVRATPVEVERFGARPGLRVDLRAADVRLRVGGRPGGESAARSHGVTGPVGELRLVPGLLYDAVGRPVAVIREVRRHVESVDVTTFAGGTAVASGVGRIEFAAEALAGVQLV